MVEQVVWLLKILNSVFSFCEVLFQMNVFTVISSEMLHLLFCHFFVSLFNILRSEKEYMIFQSLTEPRRKVYHLIICKCIMFWNRNQLLSKELLRVKEGVSCGARTVTIRSVTLLTTDWEGAGKNYLKCKASLGAPIHEWCRINKIETKVIGLKQ